MKLSVSKYIYIINLLFFHKFIRLFAHCPQCVSSNGFRDIMPTRFPQHYITWSITLKKKKRKQKKTRAGVCKTLCPQLPDSNTVWLQHCLAMTVTTVQIYNFNVILSKGNNSKIGDDWDKKKIRITYFFMRNQNMKFQNISIHGSKLMLYTIKQRH